MRGLLALKRMKTLNLELLTRVAEDFNVHVPKRNVLAFYPVRKEIREEQPLAIGRYIIRPCKVI